LPPADIAAAITAAAPCAAPGSLRALAVQLRPRHFHATFSALWRRYIYLFPLRRPNTHPLTTTATTTTSPSPPPTESSDCSNSGNTRQQDGSNTCSHPPRSSSSSFPTSTSSHPAAPASEPPPHPRRPPLPPEVFTADPDPVLLAAQLRQLQHRRLDFLAAARDTPPGKDGMCTLHLARCFVAELPSRLAGTAVGGLKTGVPLAAAAAASPGSPSESNVVEAVRQDNAPVRVLCVELV
ncbi:hypothetical protein Agub_g13095, partial [Astrephomene gubernaculifera]